MKTEIIVRSEKPFGQLDSSAERSKERSRSYFIDDSLSPEQALSSLNELKQREGQAFESLMTDRTRELFDAD